MAKARAYAAGAAFSGIVGFSFLGVKAVTNMTDPVFVLAYRFDFAFATAAILALLGVIKIKLRRQGLAGALVAAFTYGGFMALQTVGLKYSTSVEGGILFAIIPVITMIIARIFLKERITGLQSVFMSVSVAGVLLLILLASGVLRLSGGGEAHDMASGWSTSITGVLILFLSSIMLAVSNVTMRYVRGKLSPMETSFVMMLACAVTFSVAALIMGAVSGKLAEGIMIVTDMRFVIAIAYLGILSTFVTSALINYMMIHMKAVQTTLFGNLSTAISIVAGALFMNEPVYAYHVICTILIIVGVLGTNIVGSKNVGAALEEESSDVPCGEDKTSEGQK